MFFDEFGNGWDEDIESLAEAVTDLRRALADALQCRDIWCMCDAHELLRDTEWMGS